MHRFYWNFGDGTSSTTDYQTAYHTYYDPGTYNYSVVVENLCHSDTAFYGVIEIQEDYSGSEEYYLYHYYDEICTGTPVIMRVSGDYPNLLHDFNWDFGDGNTLSGPYYTYHTFEHPGIYEVTVDFQNGCGEQFFVSKTVTVKENTLPNRNIEVYTYHDVYCQGQKVGFYLSPFQDLNIHKAVWQFGDGNSTEGYGFSTYHQYQNAGIYQYEVTVFSNCGYDTTLTGQVEIRDDLLQTYSTWLEVIPGHVCPGEEARISLYPYSGFSGQIVYDLGDGTIMEGEESIKHIFSSEGTYEINASLTDGCGNEKIVSRTIEVSNHATPDPFDYEVDDYYEACPGDTIIFKVLHTGASFSIGFGDGSYANMSEIQLIGDKQYHIARHAYEETGTYIGAINITNSCGNQLTKKITIVIADEVLYDTYDLISFSPETFYSLSYCTGEDIHFFSGIGTNIEWDFGDNTPPVITSHAQIPMVSHTYDAPGQYIVRIKTTNSCGHTSIMFRSIYVQECTVGMHDNITLQNGFIHVFPNPSSGSFNLEFNSKEKDVKVNLFTINGQLVHKESIKSVDKSQQIRLSTEYLPASMYILEATTKTKTDIKKLVIF
jgi:PKD repeat protein